MMCVENIMLNIQGSQISFPKELNNFPLLVSSSQQNDGKSFLQLITEHHK